MWRADALRCRRAFFCSAARFRRLSSSSAPRPPSTSTSLARPAGSLLFTPEQQKAVAVSRAAERRRFGLTVWQLLGGGVLGAGLLTRAYLRQYDETRGWSPPRLPVLDAPMPPYSLVRTQPQVEALLSQVRCVLARHGIGIASVPLRVRILLEDEVDAGRIVEGSTRKVVRPPPLLRGIEAVSIRPGLTAIHAAQVLAHEYAHCWLWLQRFPPLEPRVEEGLCELVSYLFLLSSIREPLDGAAVSLVHDERALSQQIASIEANAHPDYGGGFRECTAALRGRTLHELLSYVYIHARLPEPLPDATSAVLL